MRWLAIVAMLIAWPAYAHQAPSGWTYPTSCCSGRDCREVHGDVEITDRGFYIKSIDYLVEFGSRKIKASPDSHYHVCWYRSYNGAPYVPCLYVPSMG